MRWQVQKYEGQGCPQQACSLVRHSARSVAAAVAEKQCRHSRQTVLEAQGLGLGGWLQET